MSLGRFTPKAWRKQRIITKADNIDTIVISLFSFVLIAEGRSKRQIAALAINANSIIFRSLLFKLTLDKNYAEGQNGEDILNKAP